MISFQRNNDNNIKDDLPEINPYIWGSLNESNIFCKVEDLIKEKYYSIEEDLREINIYSVD